VAFDLFISYSRNDTEKAVRLSDFLQSHGYSVWIDLNRLEAATLWTSEIVRAISECKAFILLLSPNSIDSKNVVRELALASEKGKHVLPIRCEHAVIPESMEYPLAGIQRVPFGEDEMLLHALTHLGLTVGESRQSIVSRQLPATKRRYGRLTSSIAVTVCAISAAYFVWPRSHPIGLTMPVVQSHLATLMIMPLEDLSRSHDLAWFADGLVSELVHSVSSIKGIRMIDQSTSFSYRGTSRQSAAIAKELNVRYFVEGSVRRSGTQFRLVLQLFDHEKGAYMWKDEFEGTVNDVFKIQEAIARKVLAGMELSLSADEDYRLAMRGTPLYMPHADNER
jgi:TolB-like protein